MQKNIQTTQQHPLFGYSKKLLENLRGFEIIASSRVFQRKQREKYNDDNVQLQFLFKNCRIDDKTKEDEKIETNTKLIKFCKEIFDRIAQREDGKKYLAVLKACYTPNLKGTTVAEILRNAQHSKDSDYIAKTLHISRRTLFNRKKIAINIFSEELEKFIKENQQ